MRHACERAEIEPAITFHILRHTYASRLAMRGVPLNVIAKQLGHSDTRMTEKHYAPWISVRQQRLDSFMLPVVCGKKKNAA